MIYQSGRKNCAVWVLKPLIIAIVVIGAIFALGRLIPQVNVFNNDYLFYYVFIALMSFLFVRWARTRINEVVVDESGERLLIKFYNLYEGQSEAVVKFTCLQINVLVNQWYGKKNVGQIWLSKNEGTSYTISKLKDGFSKETLNRLGEALNALNLPSDSKMAKAI